jgi:hypothetical protein
VPRRLVGGPEKVDLLRQKFAHLSILQIFRKSSKISVSHRKAFGP